MSTIPSELYHEILLRLPAESLFRFRSVCKEWLRIIDDPSFIKAHTNNQLYSHTLLLTDRSGHPFCSFSMDSLNFIEANQMVDATRIEPFIRHGMPLLPPTYHQHSCNGLTLISGTEIRDFLAICNPLTKDFLQLPLPIALSKLSSYVLCGVGFGYDYEADDYKVVRIDKSVSGPIQTLIYSLKSNSWRKIQDCPFYTHIFISSTCLNDTLYWLSSKVEYKILALDLRTESYSQLPLPPVDIRSEYFEYDAFWFSLHSMDGCLICSLDNYKTHFFDGWAMNDNGVEKSWIKLFSLQYYPGNISGRLRLVAYLKRKQQVVLQHESGFLWFHIEKSYVLNFSIHGLPKITSSKICPGSLVRLNSRAIGLGAVTATGTLTAKRKRMTKRTDTRLEFNVRIA